MGLLLLWLTRTHSSKCIPTSVRKLNSLGSNKYPDPIDRQRQVPLPKVYDALLVGPRTPKQNKECDQAAVHHLGVPLSQVFAKSWA